MASIAPPLPHNRVLIKDKPEKGKLEQSVPTVEIWRAGASTPQLVSTTEKQKPIAGKLGTAMIAADEPVSVVLRFHRSLAGKVLELRASRGVVINPPEPRLLLSSTGEVILQVAFEPGQNRGEISFEIDNIKNAMPLMRVRAEMLAGIETNGGEVTR